MQRFDLSGRNIVVMGGTTGLGLSAARAFIEHGARVLVVGRNKANVHLAWAQLGPKALALAGDACDSETAEKAVRMVVRRWGALHGLYHVAGGSGRRMGDGPLHELTDAGWKATLDLNLTSVVFSNRAATCQFLAQGTGGTILNMGSVLGWSPSPKYFATHSYAAAKSAIIGLTRALASYYAPHNIRFNLLAPGLVATPMARRASNDSEILRFTRSKQPLDGGRIGTAEDSDGAAVYFMSEASRFTTGQVLAVDGGWEVSEGQYGRVRGSAKRRKGKKRE
jgi:NAD(P)-dependent dehydrogenase (short-subunit alcohol dehydrogenase family)